MANTHIADRHATQIDKAQRRRMAFERIGELGVDPLIHQANIMNDALPCRFCDDGRVTETRWVALMRVDDIDVMRDASPTKKVTCPECMGTNKRLVTVNQMMQAGKNLLKKTDPDLASHRLIEEAEKLPLVRRLYNEDSKHRLGTANITGHFMSLQHEIEKHKPLDEPFDTGKITDDADQIEDSPTDEDVEIHDFSKSSDVGDAGGKPLLFAPTVDKKVPVMSRKQYQPKPPQQPKPVVDDDEPEVYWPT